MRIALFLRLAADRHRLSLLLRELDSRRRQIHLAANDRLDPGSLAGLIEVDSPKDIAVVRHRHRRHLRPLGLFHQGLDPHRPIEGGVFSVQMQVDKRVGWHCAERAKRGGILILEKAQSTARRTKDFRTNCRHNPVPRISDPSKSWTKGTRALS